MASIYWTGGAPAVAQVQSFAFAGTWETDDYIKITIGSKTVYVVAGSATTTTVIDNVVTAWNALSSSVYPEFAEITASRSSSNLLLTADTAGKPFTATLTPLESDLSAAGANTIGGGTTATTGTVSTATSGPYDVSIAANWSGGAIPVGAIAAAPVQSAASAISGGTLTDTSTFYWVVTAINANGETVKSNERNLTIAAPNQTATISWAAVTNATSYKVYRGTAAGTYGATSLVASTTALTLNDTGAALSSGTPPVSSTAIGDTVTIDKEGARLRYNLDQSTISLASRRIVARDVEIGLPPENKDGTAYPEYRAQYWQCAATLDFVSTRSNFIRLDHGTGQTTFELANSGGGRNNVPAVHLCGSHASNSWSILGGSAIFAPYAGDSARVNVGRIDAGAVVVCGFGCVNDTWNNYGGTLTIHSAIATALNHPGTGNARTTIEGAGAVAQITAQGGTVNYNTTGALGGNTLLAGNAFLNFDDDSQVKTVTNPIDLYSASARVADTHGVISGGYTLDFNNCVGRVTLKPNSRIVCSSL